MGTTEAKRFCLAHRESPPLAHKSPLAPRPSWGILLVAVGGRHERASVSVRLGDTLHGARGFPPGVFFLLGRAKESAAATKTAECAVTAATYVSHDPVFSRARQRFVNEMQHGVLCARLLCILLEVGAADDPQTT